MKKVFLIVCALIGIFVAKLVWDYATYEQPRFFPLDNPQAMYSVSKGCPGAQGWDEQKRADGMGYCIEYKGTNVFADDRNTNFFRITVGQSAVDLGQFLGRRVKNIKGKFVSSDKQCIIRQCISIGGPYVVLDVESLELAQ